MNPRVWFKSISLENVRSFGTKQTINFTDKDGKAARWNVILGDNGTGKTTVLKALCFALSDFNENIVLNRQQYYSSMLRSTNRELALNIEYEKGEYELLNHQFTIFYSGRGYVKKSLWGEADNTRYMSDILEQVGGYAYGASRRMSRSSITDGQIQYSANSLFDENTDLINAEEWLVQADYIRLRDKVYEKRFIEVSKAIKTLFREEGSGIMFDISSGVPKVRLVTQYGLVPIHELSLGYKTLIAWMVDFAKGLLDRYPDSENPFAEPAVCLVDEIDLHLHPKFQRTIIQFLTDTFPNTQFIVTAHSPLIVQSAGDANIILLKREGDETHVAESIDVHSWRIDQILSSDLFGGISTRPPETESKMQRRRALLLKDTRTKKEDQELAQLEEELGQLTSSESWEALKALELIGKALSK